MEEENYVYIYNRKGVMYITPSLSLADERRTDDFPIYQIKTND